MLSPYVPAPLAVAALCSAVVAGAATTVTAPAEKRAFNLPRGDAAVTLKQFAAAAGTPIVYLVDRVRGATTNAVTGEFTPRDALDRMLAGSALEAAQDAATGALVVSRKRTIEAAPRSGEVGPVSDPEPQPKTKPMKSPRPLLAAIVGWIAASTATEAQTAVIQAKDETVTLSPFVINAEQDRGYQAASSLSGSRIRTDLGDIASSISVLTSEFLADTGATDIRSALLYVGNIETTANYITPGGGATTGAADDENETRNPGATRVRGLGGATNLRDFFATNSPLDSYNLDRVDVIRGPNSILFGLGSPAGAIERGLKVAKSDKNRTSILSRYGSFDSWRMEFDHNQVLLKNRLALRVVAMSQDWKNLPAKPQTNRDDRIYGTVSARLTATTMLRANFEHIRTDSNRARNLPPLDGISGWLSNGKPVWDSGSADQLKTVVPAGLQPLPSAGSPILYYQNGSPMPANALWAQNGLSRLGQLTTANIYQGVSFFAVPTVGDQTLFPFRKMNFDASAKYNQNWNTGMVSLEQTLFKDLTLNLSAFTETGDNNYFSPLRGSGRQIEVDINRTLPSGAANPNFLRPYVESQTNGQDSHNESKAMRATAAYKLDLAKISPWLGRVWLTAVAENYRNTFRSIGTRDFVTAAPAGAPIAATSSTLTRQNDTHRWYIGPAIDPNSGNAWAIDAGPWVINSLGDGTPITYYDGTTTSSTFQKWIIGDFKIPRYVPTGGSKGDNIVNGQGASAQWTLLKERLVLTGGIRRDRQKTRNAPSPAAETTYYSTMVDDANWKVGPWDQGIGGTTSTIGAVLKPTRWLSLLYNQSKTFQPFGNQIDLFSRSVPAPSGTGKDYGVLLSLFDRKLSLRATQFDGSQINSRLGAISLITGNRVFSGEELILSRLYTPASNAVQLPGVVTPPYEAPPAGYPGRVNNVVDTSDLSAKGLELELTYNPLRNLRLGFNAAKQQTIETNTGRMTKEYLRQRESFLQKIYPLYTSSARNQTFQEWYRDIVYFPMANATITEGRVSPAQRKWRWNVFGTYEFGKNSVLNGFSIGGAIRWEDKGAIGYPITLDPKLGNVSDIDHPYYSGTTFNQDAWVGYARKIMRNRVLWKIQINLRNLTAGASPKLIAINKNPNGSVGAYRIPDPTQGFITNTFSF